MVDVLLGVMILGPLVLTFLLKSNAALGFLALCAGFVLSTAVIGDLKQLLSQLNLSTTDSTIGLIMLILPLALTLLFTRRSSTKGFIFWLQLATALCAGGLLALSVGPILSGSSQFNVSHSSFWNDLQKIQSGIIGAGGLLSLLLVWFASFKSHGKHHK